MGERTARERIGAMFRDNLHGKYKSSAKNKVAARTMKKKRSSTSSKGEDCSNSSFTERSGEFEDFSDIFD